MTPTTIIKQVSQAPTTTVQPTAALQRSPGVQVRDAWGVGTPPCAFSWGARQGCDPSWPTVADWPCVLVLLQEVMGFCPFVALSPCGSAPLLLYSCGSVAPALLTMALSSEAPKLKN